MNTLEAIKHAAGQRLVVGFEGQDRLPSSVCEALASGSIGGVILFKRNIAPGDTGMAQLAELTAEIHRVARATPLVAVDQEGGRVRRMRDGVLPIPPMLRVGESGDPAVAERMGRILGEQVAHLGFNVNFAPVLDVWTNPENQVIGDRAFGRAPEEAAAMACAFLRGMNETGVLPCGKHFPGHGDTKADSHVELPILNHDLRRLHALEFVPFVKAISAGIPMIMTAHILMTALDPDHPMTVSPRFKDLLRGELGFEGVIVSDDLEMHAVADRYSVEDLVERTVAAGVDLLLICHSESKWQRAFEHSVRKAESDSGFRDALFASEARIAALKTSLPATPYVPPTDLASLLNDPSDLAWLKGAFP